MHLDWLLLGAIVGFLIMTVLEAGSVYGIRHLREPEKACPAIGILYLRAVERRSTKFTYEIVALEAPLLCILLAGYLLAPSELVDFLFARPVPSINLFLTLALAGFLVAVCWTTETTEGPTDEEEPTDEESELEPA